MFLVAFLLIWTLLHIYVLARAASVPAVARHVPRKAFVVVGLLLWPTFLAAHFTALAPLPWLSWALEEVGANWLGILFVMCVTLLAADLVTGFGYLLPRRAPVLRACALLAGIVLSLIALVQGLRAPLVRNYEIQLAGLPRQADGTVLVVASDLHLGAMLGETWLAARVNQIDAQRPDLIVLAGDIVEGNGGSTDRFLPAMRRLSAPLGVWAVNGNHEGYGQSSSADQLLRAAGIHILRDCWAEARPGLVIAGVDDLTSRSRRGEAGAQFVDRALAGRPPSDATVLISHTPWQAEKAASRGVELMLSGHTHSGQIWPFNYIVGMRYPFLAGRYNVAGMPLIVCRGTGTWGPRMRLWSRSEILRITLRARPAVWGN